MNRKAVVVIVAVVAVLIGAVALALTVGREESGTDDHVHIEPITTADEVAVAVMAVMGLIYYGVLRLTFGWLSRKCYTDKR